MSERYNIYVPIQINGRDKSGEIVNEVTFSINISSAGAYLFTHHRWEKDEEVLLSIERETSLKKGVAAPVFHCRATIVRFDQAIADGDMNGAAVRFEDGFRLSVAPDNVS